MLQIIGPRLEIKIQAINCSRFFQPDIKKLTLTQYWSCDDSDFTFFKNFGLYFGFSGNFKLRFGGILQNLYAVTEQLIYTHILRYQVY